MLPICPFHVQGSKLHLVVHTFNNADGITDSGEAVIVEFPEILEYVRVDIIPFRKRQVNDDSAL